MVCFFFQLFSFFFSFSQNELFIYPFIHSFIHPFIYLFICLFVYSLSLFILEQSNSRPTSEKGTARPKTAAARQRPASAARQRPSSAARQRPGSAFGQRPGSSLSSSGSQSELTGIFQMGDDSSDLTHGMFL